MRRHPSGEGPEYTVAEGDSLWLIAERHLETTNIARIARYWPQIHRLNRDIIGGDPSRLLAGQVLTLPLESEL